MNEIKAQRPIRSTTASMEGIEQALEALAYRSRRSAKARLVDAIRQVYQRAGAPESVTSVSTDDLVRSLWDVGSDGSALISRRRNLSSLRSSVNADLMSLYRKGANPEGVIIGPDNTFVICEEAKDQALEALRDLVPGQGGGLDLREVGAFLRRIHGLLEQEEGRGQDVSAREALQAAVRGLAAHLEAPMPELDGEAQGLEAEAALGVEPGGAGAGPDEGDIEEALEEGEVEDVLEAVDDDAEEVEALEDGGGGEAEEGLEEGEVEDVLEAVDDDAEEVEALEDGGGGEAEEALEEGEVEDVLEAVDEAAEEVEDEFEEEAGDGDPSPEPALDGWDGVLDEASWAARDPERSRLLAEEFNRSLAAMDRFYNQYILVPEGRYRAQGSDVGLSAFYMGKFPITNALFEVFVEKTGYRTTAERLSSGTVYQGRYRRGKDPQSGRDVLHVASGVTFSTVQGACWYQPLGPGSTLRGKRNHPVVQVSLEDAMAFAAWTGKRLPTEEEWEGAMRTLEGRRFPWGDAWKAEVCNVEESWIGDTSRVDRFSDNENPLGLADGMGNVLEWTSTGGRGVNQAQWVGKGAGWIAGNGVSLKSRSLLPRDNRSNVLGFRCVAF